ncbi:MAG: hypothetical protein IPO62_10875 [Saprospiraceae bacterium]|nr:hypothetical protein [Saprospiraceae bacterium]
MRTCIALFIASALLILPSCTFVYYHPNINTGTGLKQKNDLITKTYLTENQEVKGFGGDISYSPIEKTALQIKGEYLASYKEDIKDYSRFGKGYNLELYYGRYQVAHKYLLFEWMGGMGYTDLKVRNLEVGQDLHLNYFKYSLRGSVSLRTNYIEIGYSLGLTRLSPLKGDFEHLSFDFLTAEFNFTRSMYDKKPSHFLEQSFYWSLGYKYLRFFLSYSANKNIFKSDFVSNNFSINIGTQINIFELTQQLKN